MSSSLRSVTFLIVALTTARGFAAIEIDLSVASADWTVWGGNGADYLGHVAIGDVNGDGIPDLAFGEASWDAGSNVGRVCIFFGPMSFPAEHDLATVLPPTCVVGDAAGALIGGELRIRDLDGDGSHDLLIGQATDVSGGGALDAGASAIVT